MPSSGRSGSAWWWKRTPRRRTARPPCSSRSSSGTPACANGAARPRSATTPSTPPASGRSTCTGGYSRREAGMPEVKRLLKAVRASQPFNAVATVAARGALRVLGTRSELLVRHLHRVGRVRCPLPDGRVLTLWSRGDDWVSNQVFWKGWTGYEPETVVPFFRAAGRAQTVVDVGAYVGFFTLLAAHANPAARVFAFEPHPAVHQRLLRNVGLNHVPNVTCVPAAVGDERGTAELVHVPGGLPTSSSLSPEFMAVHPE